MRLGLLGPADDDEEALRDGIEFLLGDVDVDQVIYLGENVEFLDAALRAWSGEALGGEEPRAAFLDRAVSLALDGSADEIDALLSADATVRRLSRVRTIPPAPARAIEMMADRIMLFVYDKRILDEDDIHNAQLIVYGRSEASDVKRFGSRYFLTPGPIHGGRVGVVELEEDGQVSLALFETSGVPVWRETMARRTSKMSVTR